MNTPETPKPEKPLVPREISGLNVLLGGTTIRGGEPGILPFSVIRAYVKDGDITFNGDQNMPEVTLKVVIPSEKIDDVLPPSLIDSFSPTATFFGTTPLKLDEYRQIRQRLLEHNAAMIVEFLREHKGIHLFPPIDPSLMPNEKQMKELERLAQ